MCLRMRYIDGLNAMYMWVEPDKHNMNVALEKRREGKRAGFAM